jgi:hypothetical protein
MKTHSKTTLDQKSRLSPCASLVPKKMLTLSGGEHSRKKRIVLTMRNRQNRLIGVYFVEFFLSRNIWGKKPVCNCILMNKLKL